MKKLIFAAAFAIITILPAQLHAEGYLFVSPQRVDLNDKTKIAQLHLVNKSDDPKAYEIKLVNYAMGPNGSLTKKEDMPNSAKSFIRFSPRRVTLQGGEDQYIRVMARFPKKLEDGGYHVHVEFDEVEGAFTRKAKEGDANNKASFEIASSYSVAIPIFAEKGRTEANADLISATPKVKKNSNKGEVNVKIKRVGNATSYNLVKIHYIDKSGKPHIASTPAKIPVYREADEIDRRFVLNLPEGVRFNGGELKVSLYPINSKDEGNPLDEIVAKIQ